MKISIFFSLTISLVSSLALANTGAAINKRTGNINYLQGKEPRKVLIAMALKACRSEKGVAPRDCAAVANTKGICESAKTGFDGAFAGHYNSSTGGWQGFMACGATLSVARDVLDTMCDQCSMGGTFYDSSVDE